MDAIQLKDFMQYHFLSSVQYAPDGRRAAFVVSQCSEDESGYEGRLWLWEKSGLRQLTDMGKEGRFVWEDSEHLLFPAVRTDAEKKRREAKDQFTSCYRLDLRGGEALHAFTLPFTAVRLEKTDWGFAALGSIDADRPDYYKMTPEEREQAAKDAEAEKDYEVLGELPFWANGGGMTGRQRTALFAVSPEGSVRRVTPPDFDVECMTVQGGSVYFAGVSFTAKRPVKNGAVWRLDGLTGGMEKLTDCPSLMIGEMLAVGEKLWLSATDCERYGINENQWVYTVDPADGTLSLLRREEGSMYGSVGSDCRHGGGSSWQAKDGCLYHIATREGNAVVLRLLPDGTSEPVITRPGSADALALSEEADEALVIGLYDQKLQELYAADLKTGEMRQLTHFNDEALEGRYVAEPRRMVIESCGLSIEGWVLLPKDYDPSGSYPAVLDIHGGPKTVYGPVFYHEMQLWAGMGYFVFFCNPKGGDGRDNEFMDIRGHYGETDYQNLMDFTDAVLAAYPQIDRARVCVTGGSYGGFMTNWVIGHTDRFCCAASQRSISNWLSFYGVSDIGFYFANDQNAADFYKHPEILWEHSPLRYAAQVKTPTLFIHSDEDYRCPLEQGLQMYSALLDRGVPARMCLFHGENHELSRSGLPKHRARRLSEITDWFQKYSRTKE